MKKKQLTILGVMALVTSMNSTLFAQIGINTDKPASTLEINGSFEASYREITASSSLTANDYHVSYSGTGNSVLNFPSKSLTDNSSGDFRGRKYYIKNNSSAGILTLTSASGQQFRYGGSTTATNTYDLSSGNYIILTAGDTNGWNIDFIAPTIPLTPSSKGVLSAVYSKIATTPVSIVQGTTASIPGATINIHLDNTSDIIVNYLGVATGTSTPTVIGKAFQGTLDLYLKPISTGVDAKMNSTYYISSANAYDYDGIPELYPASASANTTYIITNLAAGDYVISLKGTSWYGTTKWNVNPYPSFSGSAAIDVDALRARITATVYNH